MSKRGENIWHRKDGRWEARYVKNRLNGRAVYGYVYVKTYKDAKEKQLLKSKEIDSFTALKCNIFMNELFDFSKTKSITLKRVHIQKTQEILIII